MINNLNTRNMMPKYKRGDGTGSGVNE